MMDEIQQRLGLVLGQVSYKDWVLIWRFEPGNAYLKWCFMAPDYTPGADTKPKSWTTRKYQLSRHMTESELVQTAFFAALQAEEHECREAFRYKKAAPFNPHIDINALLEVSHRQEVRA
jgi:hypothetical protein